LFVSAGYGLCRNKAPGRARRRAGSFWYTEAPASPPNSAVIVGKITDSENKEPLPGANVVLENTQYGAATDNEGNYRITDIPPGSYRLIVSMIGYRKEYRKIKVRDSETFHLDISLVMAPIMGEEIVVTGTKSLKIIKDVPVRTMIVTPEKIKEKSATNLYEALENVPGIRVEQRCSNCNFTTVRVAGLEGQYTQTLIDGQPIFSGLAGVYGLQQLQTGNIERIEVVKGSGSALYGSSAIGGVINVIMKEPSLLPSVDVGVNMGSFGTNSFYINGSQRRGDVGLVFSAQKDMHKAVDMTGGDSPPYKDIGKDGYTDRVETDNLGASTKLYWYNPVGEDSKVKLSARVISETRQGGRLATWDDPFDIDSEQIKTLRYETGLGFEKPLPRGDRMKLDAEYVFHDRNATNGAAWDKAIEAGILEEDLNLTEKGWEYIDNYDFNRFKEEWYPKPFISTEHIYFSDLSYSLPLDSLTLLTGLQYRKSRLDQNINGTQSNRHADDLGVYVQADLNLVKKVEMVSGLRYDIHKSYDQLTDSEYNTTALSPRFALRYSLTDQITLRGNIGTGFRVPYLFSEDLHLCASAPRIYKGKDLKAERSLSLSLGADMYRKTFRAGASIFRTAIKDKIVFLSPEEEPIPPGYDFKYSNVGNAYTQGFELSLGGLAFNYLLDYDMNVVYTDARLNKPRYTRENYPTDNDGWKYSDRIPRSPEWTGDVAVTLKPRRWRLMLDLSYTGSMFIDHCHEEDAGNLIIEKTDPFVLVNAKVTRLLSRKLQVFVGARNLLNYTQPRRDRTDSAYIYAPLIGRLIYAGMDLSLR